MRLLIDDGFTLDGTIPGQGPWPTITFKYRPALPERVYEFLKNTKAAGSGKKHQEEVSKLLTEQLVSWDVTDAKDEATPITAAILRRVPHPLLVKLVDHVTGYGEAQGEVDRKN